MTDDLTRLQQILLGTDGTVTHILEAYAGEPIEVVKLSQDYDTANESDGPLELPPGTEVLRRRVVLRGERGHQPLLHAEAVIVPARVSRAVLDGLIETNKPIGALLTENRTETFREILNVGREDNGAVVFRTYRIIIAGRPSMLITERFPAHFLRELPP